MKRFAILSVLYIYLETGICIEEPNISPVDANSDIAAYRSPTWQSTVAKRNSAFKRLPAWSVYYGKRSSESGLSEDTDFKNTGDNDIIGENDPGIGETTYPASLVYYLQKLQDDHGETPYIDATKRANFKRLQTWMSTYGKRSDLLDGSYDADADISEDDLENIKRAKELSQNVYDMQSDEDEDDLKRAPGWHATYGKRLPGWSATYGKRAPSWLSTYGKRIAGWSATYGKRAPTWSITYGKRAPAWSITYGKRLPGWSATYGKRVPWATTYGKRVPWGATYGKRVPWGATYGKRIPWGATYGKRSQSWNAFYGKRAPMWQAVYGKRDGADTTANDDNINLIDKSDDTSDIGEKRSQAWSAFYGR